MASADMDYGGLRRTWRQRVKQSLRDCRAELSLRLCLFEEEFCLDLFGFLIALPFLDRWHREPHEIMESWGVYYHESSVVWCWGDYTKFFHMPWDYDHIKHEVMRPDGSWVPFVGSWETGEPVKNTDGKVVFEGFKEPDGRWVGVYSYRYTLKSGEVQERTATVYVERREWRQKWLKWTPLFAKVRKSIDYTFSDEVGERAGSWKGGCISSGETMRKGETPEQTFRRMERERVFD